MDINTVSTQTSSNLVNPPAGVGCVPVDVGLVLHPVPGSSGVQFLPHLGWGPAVTLTNLLESRRNGLR